VHPPRPLAARDAAGFVDLRSYAVIGDTRTAALVSHDGAIDWRALPDLDSPPVFGRLLDGEDGGHFTLAPVADHEAQRRYVPGTNVLETTYTTDAGRVCATDAINVGTTGRLPWGELARRVDGLEGEVELAWCLRPGTGLRRFSPWIEDTANGPVVRVDAVTMAVRLHEAGEPSLDDREVAGAFTATPASRHLVALVSSAGEPLRLPDPRWIDANVDKSVEQWRRWTAQFE
jgi:GH15 family glucan-1,4-alpha-glucosidase